jgi:hypothetical protein
MSDLSEVIEGERRNRTRRTPRKSRKERSATRKGPSKPGGLILLCGCRWLYSGAWRHVTPCRVHELQLRPAADLEFWGAE